MSGWHLSGQPYAVQSKAGDLARGHGGFAYFLEQGLGKTAVILNEAVELYVDDRIECLLVICPNSIKTNWVDEAKNFGWKGGVYVWPKPPKLYGKGQPDGLFLVTMNYEAVITPSGTKFIQELCDKYEVMCALDESSRIKNPQSQRTKRLLGLSSGMVVKRVATGTPVTKSPADLWSQLGFIGRMPMKFYPFRNRYCQMGGYLGKQIIGAKPEMLDELKARMAEAAFIAKKKDWTDLPEKRYMPPRMFEMKGEQLRVYREMYTDFCAEIGPDQMVEATMAVTQLNKLQQITSGFVYDAEHNPIWFFNDQRQNPKIQVMQEILDEAQGKTIIFTVFRPTTDMVIDHLTLAGMKPAYIRGGMSDQDRDISRRRFNDDPECRAIVCQISAGGIGLTLLGQPGPDRCSTTIFFENSFDLEFRLQAEDRNHRHGQDEMVTYWDLAGSPTCKKCAVSLQRKEDLANLVVDPSFWLQEAA